VSASRDVLFPRSVAAVVLVAVLGAGCGDESSSKSSPDRTASPAAAVTAGPDAADSTGGFDPATCSFDGKPLWGKVYMTDDPAEADVNVWFDQDPAPGHLRVYIVSRPGEATSCGLWEMVPEADGADVAVHVPSDPALVDVQLAEVPTSRDAGAL
jgi:hypothetical protein